MYRPEAHQRPCYLKNARRICNAAHAKSESVVLYVSIYAVTVTVAVAVAVTVSTAAWVASSCSGARSDWSAIVSSQSAALHCAAQTGLERVRSSTDLVEYDADHQAAAGAARNVFAVAHVGNGNLEAVAARTRVVVDLQRRIVEAVLDLDLVVQVQLLVGHGRRVRGACGCGCGCGCTKAASRRRVAAGGGRRRRGGRAISPCLGAGGGRGAPLRSLRCAGLDCTMTTR
jgi:hypothetical protein